MKPILKVYTESVSRINKTLIHQVGSENATANDLWIRNSKYTEAQQRTVAFTAQYWYNGAVLKNYIAYQLLFVTTYSFTSNYCTSIP
ncbi:hypothetical protein T11_4237, partial [Trichinella zimbabwensis]